MSAAEMANAATKPAAATSGKIAVYDAPNAPFVLRDFPLRAPKPGEVLVKVRMCTICRSDIHSYLGHRPNPTPGVLGHEIIGTIGSTADDFTRAAQLLNDNKLNLDLVIDHIVPFDNPKDAFEKSIQPNTYRVVMKP
jgi:threonine dehydrogenase-like Zn-dependent dehydrogenase